MNVLKKTSLIDGNTLVKTVHRSVNMLLCNSCYWCATQLEEAEDNACPRCSNVIEAIPIGRGETFSFQVDSKKGVLLEFTRTE